MNRVALAILGVVLAVMIIVVIARESSDEKAPPPPPKPVPIASSTPPPPHGGHGEPDVLDPDEIDLEVKELSFGDGSANQRSIRIEGANTEMTTRLRDWLEPRESAAVASRSAIDCRAQLAKTTLVSVVCVTMPAGEPDAGTSLDAGVARYESLTLRVVNGETKELTLPDILVAVAGQPDVVAACKKTADAPTCVWPPTAFAVGPEGALFLCHDSHCVTIEGEPLVRPELR